MIPRLHIAFLPQHCNCRETKEEGGLITGMASVVCLNSEWRWRGKTKMKMMHMAKRSHIILFHCTENALVMLPQHHHLHRVYLVRSQQYRLVRHCTHPAQGGPKSHLKWAPISIRWEEQKYLQLLPLYLLLLQNRLLHGGEKEMMTLLHQDGQTIHSGH